MSNEHSIRFVQANKTFDKTEVIKSLDLEIKKGERMILLGPSGCGKSTILRMISGLESLSGGELYLNDVLANDIDSGDRGIAMVFQNYALFPHMSVEDNIAYGLKINKVNKEEVKARVAEVVDILSLTGLEKRLPRELSGGQRQRVALGRALVKRSDFLLLDEPLSNLDAQLRGQARKELVKIHELYNQTFVYVTHDQIEAMTIGQRIALMNNGVLQMLDTPHNVYHRPANIFVATFIGSPSMNIADVKVEGGRVYLAGQSFPLTEEWNAQILACGSKNLKLGIRPEDVFLTDAPTDRCLEVDIQYVEDYGNRVGFYFELDDKEIISIMPENLFRKGARCWWNINPMKLHFFDADTEQNIGYPETVLAYGRVNQ